MVKTMQGRCVGTKLISRSPTAMLWSTGIRSAPSPYPDHRSGHSSGCRSRYLHDRSRGLPGHRDGEPSRPFGPFPCGGCLSCSCQPCPGFPVHCRPRRATNPCGRPPEGDRRSEPACATDLGRLSTTRPLATCQLHSDFSLPLPREWSRVTGVAGDEDSKSICERASNSLSPRCSFRSILDRGRWMFGLRVAPSGPLRCCHRPVSRRCVPFPLPPGPPRYCADLRCLTTRRSHSLGFAAPPTSLASRPGPWRLSPGRRSC
jgi:hypothetical protein